MCVHVLCACIRESHVFYLLRRMNLRTGQNHEPCQLLVEIGKCEGKDDIKIPFPVVHSILIRR